MKKGLRHLELSGLAVAPHSKLALMKKGLRHIGESGMAEARPFKTCPDEEGIKTDVVDRHAPCLGIQNLP